MYSALDTIDEFNAGYVGKVKLTARITGRYRGFENGEPSVMGILPPTSAAGSTAGVGPAAEKRAIIDTFERLRRIAKFKACKLR